MMKKFSPKIILLPVFLIACASQQSSLLGMETTLKSAGEVTLRSVLTSPKTWLVVSGVGFLFGAYKTINADLDIQKRSARYNEEWIGITGNHDQATDLKAQIEGKPVDEEVGVKAVVINNIYNENYDTALRLLSDGDQLNRSILKAAYKSIFTSFSLGVFLASLAWLKWGTKS